MKTFYLSQKIVLIVLLIAAMFVIFLAIQEKINELPRFVEVFDYFNQRIFVDVSNSACFRFGIKSGTRIRTPFGEAITIGVASDPEFPERPSQMWCYFEEENSEGFFSKIASYYSSWQDSSLVSDGTILILGGT